jgi:hypothetical protein
MYITYRCAVPSSQRTQFASITDTNYYILFSEINSSRGLSYDTSTASSKASSLHSAT